MNKLDKKTFERFKLIQNLINKYHINKFNKSQIDSIKEQYIEYIPKYKIIKENLHFEDSQFIDKELVDEFIHFKEYIHIEESNIDIKISYDNIDNDLINIIYSIVKLFLKLYGEKIIKLKFALTNHQRFITKKIIGTINVNGGQTDGKTIELFRREEIIKVLCHELIHFYKLDCRSIDDKQENILDKFNIKTVIINQSINEAYTEYLALIHHIALISVYINISPYLIYHYEKIWSLYQVCKILKHYGMNQFEDLYKNKFIQETNVFSYYIIKFFLIWILDNKCNYKNLKSILDDQEIINIINENMNIQFDKNLRMTLFELK
jgi:hypothetical protein